MRFREIGSCLALALPLMALAAPIATVEVTDGTVTVTRTSGKRGIVAVGSLLEEGDTLTTEKGSYARLKFTDGSEVALRPVSSLLIQRYRFDAARPAQDNLLMTIIKGGMRTVTGLIGKRDNPDAYRVQGGTGTIGIRGTEYIARVCNQDCAEDTVAGPSRHALNNNPQPLARKKISPPPTPIVARLAELQGEVAIRHGVQRRTAGLGEALYNGEIVVVGNPGSASLVLNDQSRIVLTPGSEFELASVRYTPRVPDQGNIFVRLVKGGLRMVTGVLGKSKPQHVKVETVVATIGVRGTNFDLWCAPSGNPDPANAELSPAESYPCDQALYASTRDGAIEMQSGQHKLIVPAGKVGYVDSPGAVPTLFEEAPSFLKNHSSPAPEAFAIDMARLFGVDGTALQEPGLYVSVKDGKVELTQANGESLLLQKGEAGYAGAAGQELLRLGSEPSFIQDDSYLRELRVDPATCRAQ